jgi:hypothetical protein
MKVRSADFTCICACRYAHVCNICMYACAYMYVGVYLCICVYTFASHHTRVLYFLFHSLFYEPIHSSEICYVSLISSLISKISLKAQILRDVHLIVLITENLYEPTTSNLFIFQSILLRIFMS